MLKFDYQIIDGIKHFEPKTIIFSGVTNLLGKDVFNTSLELLLYIKIEKNKNSEKLWSPLYKKACRKKNM